MNPRRLTDVDLPELARLYGFLHANDPVIDPNSPAVRSLWATILENDHLRYYGAEADGRIVSTCTLTLIPNLTRGLRPYGLIENVVTDPAHRQKGYATRVLGHALEDAWSAGCYKAMLETGRKDEATLRFYERAGFKSGVKTAFIAYPKEG